MSEQGPYGQSAPGRPTQAWPGGNQPGASGPVGPRQPAPPPGQWQGQANGPQGWHQAGPGAGQPQAGPPYPGQPGGPAAPWQPGQPNGPQGWQQPSTQQFPPAGAPGPGGPGGPAGPGGPGAPWSGQPGPTPGKNRTPVLITVIAVVVALVAAGAVYFFAIRDRNTSTAGGENTPQESVTALFTTLSNSDPIGLADRLDPAEAALFTDLNTDVITELKRLEILSPAASADAMTGTNITVQNLTFDGAPEQINPNLQIVKLTGGTITISSDPNSIPLSDKIKDAFGSTIDQAQPQSQTVNIADAVKENGGEPIRVATVQRNGQWFVSLFYTIADNAVHAAGLANPTEADRIAPVGSGSPEAAVDALIKQATAGNLEGVIAVTSPEEMGVLHDYGKLLIQQSDAGSLSSDVTDLGVTVDNVSWTTSEVTGGTKVSLASLTLTAEGQTVTLTRDAAANSVTLKVPDQPEVTLDETTIDSYLTEAMGSGSGSGDLDPQLLEIIKREFKQVIGLGVVTVEVDGQWYVSPVRSFSDVFVSLLKGLEPGDVDYLISLSGN